MQFRGSSAHNLEGISVTEGANCLQKYGASNQAGANHSASPRWDKSPAHLEEPVLRNRSTLLSQSLRSNVASCTARKQLKPPRPTIGAAAFVRSFARSGMDFLFEGARAAHGFRGRRREDAWMDGPCPLARWPVGSATDPRSVISYWQAVAVHFRAWECKLQSMP